MEETASLWDMSFGLNDDLNEIFPNLTTDPMLNKGDFLDDLLPPPLQPPIQHHRYGIGKELRLMDQVLKPSPSTKKACLDFLQESQLPPPPPIQHNHVHHGKGKELKRLIQVLKPSSSTIKACLDSLSYGKKLDITNKRLQDDYEQCNKSCLDSLSYGKKLDITKKILQDDSKQCNKACVDSLSYDKKLEVTKKRLQDDNKQCNKSCLDSLSYEKKLEMTKKRLHDDYEQCNKTRKTTRLMEYIDLPAIPQHGCGALRNKRQLKREGNRIIK